MPPRKRNNDIDRIRKMAESLGMDADRLLDAIPSTEIGAEAKERCDLEAESVLFYVRTKGAGFKQKKCAREECDQFFLHTYVAVKYCSEYCRAWELEQIGIVWNPARRHDSDRWGGKVPKIIGAAATRALKESGNFFGDEDELDE